MTALTPEIERRIAYWLNGPFDEKTKGQIRFLKEHHPKELIDAFYSELSFGTGGLRGLMGVGTNRLNVYTIQRATQGLANYLCKQYPGKKTSVLIGFDSRHHSKEFAEEAAKVLAGNGICVYLLSELRPTPYISFACRFKKANAAIMITASHNPKEYNGYKVYWSDGAQVVSPHDEGIIQEAAAIRDLSSIKLSDLSDPLIEITSTTSLDDAYFKAIAPLQSFPDVDQKRGHTLHCVYTSLHGTGITIVPKALENWGFTSLHFVEEQITPDGDFPTVKFPNPEYPEALELGIQLLLKTKSDIVFATDPDADRIGTVVLHQQKPVLINGNEMAAICVDFLCASLKQKGKMPKKGAFVTTIVTTELFKKIAQFHGCACFEVLTGFKYIGEKIAGWEDAAEGYVFIFGAEESYGYLLGTHARDKDAIITSCLIAEIALQAKMRGETLIDCLEKIYKKYGIFREGQLSINFQPGKEGMEEMTEKMHSLRIAPPTQICGKSVVCIEDYETQTRRHLGSNQVEKLELPRSDVLLLRLSDQTRLVIRPSGTEPKIKIYGSTTSESFTSLKEGIEEYDERLNLYLEAMKQLCQKG